MKTKSTLLPNNVSVYDQLQGNVNSF